MNVTDIISHIMDAIPYTIVFVDCDHVIRYLNKRAKYHYYEERGYPDLLGKSVFDCHNERSRKMIQDAFERFKNHGQEEFLMVNVRNERVYINPVRDKDGQLIGYFERFERNGSKP